MVNIPRLYPRLPKYKIWVASLLIPESITNLIAFASSCPKPRRQRRQPLDPTFRSAPQPFYPVALPYLRHNANISSFRLKRHTQEKSLSMKLPAETRIQDLATHNKQSLLPSHPKRQPHHHKPQHGSNNTLVPETLPIESAPRLPPTLFRSHRPFVQHQHLRLHKSSRLDLFPRLLYSLPPMADS